MTSYLYSPDSGTKIEADNANACIICLDTDPTPIQSSCACRGDAGLAHVKCRAHAALHDSTNSYSGWLACGICGQEFNGAMMVGLAKEWWDKVHHLPHENEERLLASGTLASALLYEHQFARAEEIERDLLITMRRVFGAEHPTTLAASMNLAHTLDSQGKHSDAVVLFRDILAVQCRVLGPDDPCTLRSHANMANAVATQNRLSDAEAMYREVLATPCSWA